MKPTVLFENVPDFLVDRLVAAAELTHRRVAREPTGEKGTYRIVCEKRDDDGDGSR